MKSKLMANITILLVLMINMLVIFGFIISFAYWDIEYFNPAKWGAWYRWICSITTIYFFAMFVFLDGESDFQRELIKFYKNKFNWE